MSQLIKKAISLELNAHQQSSAGGITASSRSLTHQSTHTNLHRKTGSPQLMVYVLQYSSFWPFPLKQKNKEYWPWRQKRRCCWTLYVPGQTSGYRSCRRKYISNNRFRDRDREDPIIYTVTVTSLLNLHYLKVSGHRVRWSFFPISQCSVNNASDSHFAYPCIHGELLVPK